MESKLPKKGFSLQHIVIIYNDLRFSLPEMSQDPKPLFSLNVLLALPEIPVHVSKYVCKCI